ncbi:MAG TPA: tRNA-dihydrouridine synthase [Spirochaetales bacterium]|nr:tRNA-dihydrouridine synthase [Spirochaetales bacterium]HPD80482.1 tRNA-dihydrouridine synthase [Spirochaetales bacterium]HQG39916.1 tRNA-dihydrouridine synthase [Spirochaetales bacterium]HQK35403.1 tRNA-dihydrouridine synthase [Spirochaetales bacterium]HRV28650.1 tRNA-dihydrouridine synthase [Spirochaetia bacterium]
MLHHPVQIGTFTVPGNIFIAPVAGYSDAAYRSICLELGADFSFTELISSEALVRNSEKTEILLKRFDNETTYAIQLFGKNPQVMAAAARYVYEHYHPAIIDINCGCPVPKVVKTGAGSALMRTPGTAADIVKAIKDSVPIPVTVKMRLGWDENSINYLNFAEAVTKAGADALTLHARTRARGYSGIADRSAFFKLAYQVSVPVIASGDMFTIEDVIEVLGNPNHGKPVQGVMIARGMMGRPFFFKEITDTLKTIDKLESQETSLPENNSPYQVSNFQVSNFQVPNSLDSKSLYQVFNHEVSNHRSSNHDVIAVAQKHLLLMVELYGEKQACVEFRKHMCAYLKGTPGGAALRQQAVHCASLQDYQHIFSLWLR